MSLRTLLDPLVPLARRARSQWRGLSRSLQQAVPRETLVRQLGEAGLLSGDVIMVHSSLSRLGKIAGGPDTVIDALLQAVGDQGTILMPTYARAGDVFTAAEQGQTVDLRTQPGGNGAICEALRRRSGSRRSSHPFSSVSALGARADWFTSGHHLDPRVTHADSPIGRFWQAGGKLVGLGTNMGPVSFYHVIEDTWDEFPIETYDAPVTVEYVDANGVSLRRPVRRFRPELAQHRIDNPANAWLKVRMTEYVDRHGLRRVFPIGHGRGWLIEAEPFYSALRTLAEAGITIYATQQDWNDVGCSGWPAPRF